MDPERNLHVRETKIRLKPADDGRLKAFAALHDIGHSVLARMLILGGLELLELYAVLERLELYAVLERHARARGVSVDRLAQLLVEQGLQRLGRGESLGALVEGVRDE